MANTYVRVCAVLIGLRSLTNLVKPFGGESTVQVFFGQPLRGDAAAIPAVAVGLFMLATAIAMWQSWPVASKLVAAYAAFVILNMLLWAVTSPEELQRVGALLSPDAAAQAQLRIGRIGMLLYAAVALATTAVPAWILWRGDDASS